MTANKLLDNFYDYLENNPLPSRRRAGASPTTIKGYVQDISVFLRWWKQSFGNELNIPLLRKDPYQLNKKTVQDFLAWLETPKFAGLLGNQLPGFFPLSKDVPELSDPVAAAFMGFNQQAKGTDIRFVWEKLLAAPSGQVDAYTAMNDAVIAVLKGQMTPQKAADSLQAALAGWYEPAKSCKK